MGHMFITVQKWHSRSSSLNRFLSLRGIALGGGVCLFHCEKGSLHSDVVGTEVF